MLQRSIGSKPINPSTETEFESDLRRAAGVREKRKGLVRMREGAPGIATTQRWWTRRWKGRRMVVSGATEMERRGRAMLVVVERTAVASREPRLMRRICLADLLKRELGGGSLKGWAVVRGDVSVVRSRRGSRQLLSGERASKSKRSGRTFLRLAVLGG